MTTPTTNQPSATTSRLRTGLIRLPWFALLWWILTEGAANSWWVGGPSVLMASTASAVLMPPLGASLTASLRFAVFFLWESLRGGLDVARRALHRRLPLDPGLMEHRWRVQPSAARVSVANTISLLPGTLAAELRNETLQVHALDAGAEVTESLQLSEQHIAALFNTPLRTPNKPGGAH